MHDNGVDNTLQMALPPATPFGLGVYVGGRRSIGERPTQQDRWFAFLKPGAGAFAVVDGAKGSADGERAAVVGIDTIAGACQTRLPAAGADVERSMKDLFREADQAIKTAGSQEKKEGMFATGVLALWLGDEIYVVGAGDTRGYSMTSTGPLTPMTKDHCFMGPDGSPSHAVYSGLGILETGNRENISYAQCSLDTLTSTGVGLLLLCSDGVTRVLEEDEDIETILRQGLKNGLTAQQLADELMSVVNVVQGRTHRLDNITIVIVLFKEGMVNCMACGKEFQPPQLTIDPDDPDWEVRYYGQVDCQKCGQAVGFACVECYETGKTPPGPHQHAGACPKDAQPQQDGGGDVTQ
jgi:serine/threonine protein phosphatase PrpC